MAPIKGLSERCTDMPGRVRYNRLAALRAELRQHLPDFGFERLSQSRESEFWQITKDDVVVTAHARAGGRRLDFWAVSLTFYWVTKEEWQFLNVPEPWPPRPPMEYWQFHGLRDRFVCATNYYGPPETPIEPNLADDEAEHWRMGVPAALHELRQQLEGVVDINGVR